MGQARKTRQRQKVKRTKRAYVQSSAPWHLYIIECLNGHLYTGITNDLSARLLAHQKGKGAKYTRIFGVKALAYHEEVGSRAEAMKRERQVKIWPRDRKMLLINM